MYDILRAVRALLSRQKDLQAVCSLNQFAYLCCPVLGGLVHDQADPGHIASWSRCATGFIGGRLISHLPANLGHCVVGMSRRDVADAPNVRYVKADVFDVAQLGDALRGIEVAYYLIHSMEGGNGHWKEFASRERVQAQNFLKAAAKAGVKRIIYLGGLVSDSRDLSPHMRSRKKVGEILASGDIR